jgi:hypothetical protein
MFSAEGWFDGGAAVNGLGERIGADCGVQLPTTLFRSNPQSTIRNPQFPPLRSIRSKNPLPVIPRQDRILPYDCCGEDAACEWIKNNIILCQPIHPSPPQSVPSAPRNPLPAIPRQDRILLYNIQQRYQPRNPQSEIRNSPQSVPSAPKIRCQSFPGRIESCPTTAK